MAPLILVCPTAFKGTLTAAQAASAMAAGAREGCDGADVVVLPLSDGGPGLIDALLATPGGAVHTVRVRDPLGRPVDARILLLELEGEPSAVIESADACGMHLLDESALEPMTLGSGGVGELIAAAAGMAPTVVVGLGGSATVDGGAGMATALGWRLLDADDRPLDAGGAALEGLERILPPDASAPGQRTVVALADVRNPLLGPLGAVAVFGPQKGAAPADLPRLEAGLARLADVIVRDLGVDVREIAGGGAAGGLGAATVAFLGADLVPGAPRVLRATGFDGPLARARLVVTGEGRWDAQSSMGKITGAVIERARAAHVPVLLVAGRSDGAAPPDVTVATQPAGTILGAEDLRRIVAREVARMAPALGC